MKRLAILLLLAACTSGGQTPSSVLPFGPHAVGYRDGRWYPAQPQGDRIRFRDYIPTLDEWDRHLHHLRFSDEEIVELFDRLMYARHEAPAVEGEFLVTQLNRRSAFA